MKIALCIKQVPDTTDIKWTENNTMQREGVESIINPCDLYAIEQALNLKKYNGAEIVVFTMGPLQAENMLREVLALGADRAVLLTDKKFAGADTYATAKTLSSAIKKILPDFDMILCGQYAIDGDTAQTGPCIAGLLDIAQVTYVKEIIENTDTTATIIRELDDGTEKIEVELPSVLCVLNSDFEPSRALINGIISAQDAQVQKIGLEDLDLTAEDVGIKGSPTYVSRAFRPEVKHGNEKLENIDADKGAEILIKKMKEIGVLNE